MQAGAVGVRHAVILAAVGVLLTAFWFTRISGQPIVWDAAHNLTMMLNLEHHGVVSLDSAEPYRPTMYREPLPAFVGQFAVRAVDAVLGRAEDEEYSSGERARLLKLQNIPWMALLGAVVFLLARELGLEFLPALGCVLALNALLLGVDMRYFMLDSLYTEAAATALFTLASLLLFTGLKRRSAWRIAGAGVSYGLLILVKATFLYILVGLLPALPILALLFHRKITTALLQALLLGALAALIVLPWMARNHRELGYFGISLRGGEVLYDRAVIDQMTRDEYIGSYYLFAPYPLNGALRRLLGYSNSDIEAGGRLQRLNLASSSNFYVRDYSAEVAGRPEDAVTYEHRAGADRVLRRNQLLDAGIAGPELLVDREMLARALAIIRQHPLRHLALTPMYLWRGAFFTFPALLMVGFYAWRQRRYELAALVLPAIALLLFYASLAHLEPRYAIPTYPIALCGIVAVGLRYAAVRISARQRVEELEPWGQAYPGWAVAHEDGHRRQPPV